MEQKKQNNVELTITEDHGKDILAALAEHTEQSFKINGVVVGIITGLDEQNSPMVDFDCNVYKRPLSAASLVPIDKIHAGRKAALMFEQNRADKPVIMGLMHTRGQAEAITAEKELVIRCGKASIRLKENGDIVISGRELISRARKDNIIRGGTIHLN